MKYEIKGDNLPVVICELSDGETMYTESNETLSNDVRESVTDAAKTAPTTPARIPRRPRACSQGQRYAVLRVSLPSSRSMPKSTYPSTENTTSITAMKVITPPTPEMAGSRKV